MDQLKRLLAIPRVKYGLLALGSGAWTVGLVEHASASTMKYLLMSLLMLVVANL